ncbi:histidine kinase [Mucilaginibacter sp. 10I4]|uniref:sensor histidine kinase n=1 Tax=Mucilaginibacter sp. 10I4 TaxID=3048580 RepID=UPI002B227DD8|nr:histidine kinase [Mucilaginibacter sp. 10I4]MEB0261811.1 histidine kinase [Mucilaginibacter sp. 10I4]
MALQSKMNFSRLDVRLILKHILGWGLFIAYEVSFIRFTVGAFSPLQNYICYYGLNIVLFYFNAHVLLSFTIKSKKSYLLIPVMILLEMLAYLFFKYILDYFLAFPPDAIPSQIVYIKKLLVPNIYRGLYLLVFSTLYWSVLRVISFRKRVHETETVQLITLKEKAELERNLAEAMNAYLQQQINPHLLFNTLTFIHNTYYKYSRKASQCVLLLVEIMRFTIDDVNFNGKTSLDKEIEQIQNFIELNQLRFDYKLYIDFHAEGDFEAHQIIPLILLTLTENIFKHGNLKKDKAKLHISVNEQHELNFVSWNLKKHQSEAKRLRSIGIKNIIKRLEYSYKHKYSLNIKDEEDSYGLELRMQL